VLKTSRQFFILAFGLILVSSLALGLVVISGDVGGQPLKAQFTFSPEGPNGFPQLAITFESTKVPERTSAESAFEVTPALTGDFGWKDSTLVFTPFTRLASNTDYQVRFRGGLKVVGGGRLNYEQSSWTFHTHPARIVYLKKEGQAVNIWLEEEGEGATPARQLTFETQRKVLDFSFSPGGESIVYSLEETDHQEAGLWLLKIPEAGNSAGVNNENKEASTPFKVVHEKGVRATAPRWSPGGDLISYERRLIFKGGAFGAAQLWLVKPDGTSLPPLYGGSGYDLQWAAGGDKAFFWEPKLEAVGVFNFTGEPQWKPLKSLIFGGLAPSPDGQEIIVSRYDYTGVQQKEVLLRLSVVKGKTETGLEPSPVQPPNEEGFNNSLPVWSPDGRWLAFIRQEMGPRTDNKDSRIWIFDPKSGNEWPLIKSDSGMKDVSQGNFSWSLDGQRIVFERYNSGTTSISEKTELWEAPMDGSESPRRITSGFAPKWIF
jgi:Tol biopolymer transport system component